MIEAVLPLLRRSQETEYEHSQRDLSFAERQHRLICDPIVLILFGCVFACAIWMPSTRTPPCRLLVWRFVCMTVVVINSLVTAILKWPYFKNVFFLASNQAFFLMAVLLTAMSVWETVFIARNPFKNDRFGASGFVFVLLFGAIQYMGVVLDFYKSTYTDDRSYDFALFKTAEDYCQDTFFIFAVSLVGISVLLSVLTAMELSWGLELSRRSRQRVIVQQFCITAAFGASDLLRGILLHRSVDEYRHGHEETVDLVLTLSWMYDAVMWFLLTGAAWTLISQIRGADGEQEDAQNEDATGEVSWMRRLEDYWAADNFEADMRHQLTVMTAIGINYCAESCVARFEGKTELQDKYRQLVERCLTSNGTISKDEFTAAGFSPELFAELHKSDSTDGLTAKQRCGYMDPRDMEVYGDSIELNSTCSQGQSSCGVRDSMDWQTAIRLTPVSNNCPSQGEAATRTSLGRSNSAENRRASHVLQAAEKGYGTASKTGGLRMPIMMGGKALEFFTYESMVFDLVRYKLGVKPETFLEAIEPIVEACGERVLKRGVTDQTEPSSDEPKLARAPSQVESFHDLNFREIMSSGASGSYFYFTPNQMFIVKQIDLGEKDQLQSMAYAYAKHCCENPETMIHYYGLYSLRLPMYSSAKIYFVVMKNFLFAPMCQELGSEPLRRESRLDKITLTFDLKGATTNRRRIKDLEKLEAINQGAKGSSLLDWDWMGLGYQMLLSNQAKRWMALQLREDLKFLASCQLLDYSLLLGVTDSHRQTLARSTAEVTPLAGPAHELLASSDHGQRGLQLASTDGRIAYCFGMIDILEGWNCRWSMQQKVLGCVLSCCSRLGNPRGITAIPPQEYAWRFEEFMLDQVLGIRLPSFPVAAAAVNPVDIDRQDNALSIEDDVLSIEELEDHGWKSAGAPTWIPWK